jgi:hypothetical protein
MRKSFCGARPANNATSYKIPLVRHFPQLQQARSLSDGYPAQSLITTHTADSPVLVAIQSTQQQGKQRYSDSRDHELSDVSSSGPERVESRGLECHTYHD